ncbi:unnamed protein product [Pleuronectes platessa]|uniref:Uncharacterized protein n=1 Tax=Pleuronectes platessa TaxID=8262 RepID=A0A9N7VY14_PLEPL|nr:unnamed protein product [Pleuronectes platessa]
MGVDGSQRIGAALTPRFGVASTSGVNPAPWSSTIQTTIHHPDQTPLQSSVTIHRRPPGPITSHHRGPGPPPVPNINTTQGPPPAPRSAHMTQNPPHWIQHRDQQTAIHGVATEALDLRVIKQRDSGDGG